MTTQVNQSWAEPAETQEIQGWAETQKCGAVKLKHVENTHSHSQLAFHLLLPVEGVKLHDIPSYSTSNPTGTGDIAGSRTWSDLVCSGSGAISGSGFSSGFPICVWVLIGTGSPLRGG